MQSHLIPINEASDGYEFMGYNYNRNTSVTSFRKSVNNVQINFAKSNLILCLVVNAL